MKKYEIRINGIIGDNTAVKVTATSKKKALEKAKKLKGIPTEQACYYMCRVIKK